MIPLLIVFLLVTMTDAWGLTIRRDIEVSATAGVLTTDHLLTVHDGAHGTVGLTVQTHVIEQMGYFLDLTVTPGVPPACQLDQRGLLGVFGAGLFWQVKIRPVTVAYRVGYGAGGDIRRATDLFLHGVTVTRPLTNRLNGYFNMKQILSDTHHFGTVNLSIGLGWRL